MMRMQARIMRSVVVIAAAFGVGAGCGAAIEEQQEPLLEEASIAQEATAEEPQGPHKVEDLIGTLDPDEGVLHTLDTHRDIVLQELKAEKVDAEKYQIKDELTGAVTVFHVIIYPWDKWLNLHKLCSNGQLIPWWQTCPTKIPWLDRLTRIWRNASCNWKIQSASWSPCTTASSGNSYQFQFMESWKCGVGRGFCVERQAVQIVRWDYAYASCDPSIVTGVTPTTNNYLCRH